MANEPPLEEVCTAPMAVTSAGELLVNAYQLAVGNNLSAAIDVAKASGLPVFVGLVVPAGIRAQLARTSTTRRPTLLGGWDRISLIGKDAGARRGELPGRPVHGFEGRPRLRLGRLPGSSRRTRARTPSPRATRTRVRKVRFMPASIRWRFLSGMRRCSAASCWVQPR